MKKTFLFATCLMAVLLSTALYADDEETFSQDQDAVVVDDTAAFDDETTPDRVRPGRPGGPGYPGNPGRPAPRPPRPGYPGHNPPPVYHPVPPPHHPYPPYYPPSPPPYYPPRDGYSCTLDTGYRLYSGYGYSLLSAQEDARYECLRFESYGTCDYGYMTCRRTY